MIRYNHMDMVNVFIDEHGDSRFLVGEGANPNPLVDDSMRITRASHVEPCNALARYAFHKLRSMFGDTGIVSDWTRTWPVWWRVNMKCINHGIMPYAWLNREHAIKAEIAYLEKNFL